VPRALEAAETLKAEHGIDCEVIDVRSLVPLDTQTILGSVARLIGCSRSRKIHGCAAGCRDSWSIVADEAFYDLDGPPVRITTPHIRCRRRYPGRRRTATPGRIVDSARVWELICVMPGLTRHPSS